MSLHFCLTPMDASDAAMGPRPPSFFLIDRNGKLAYEGAMNEDIYDNRPDGADYIRPALDDLIAGRPVKVPETQPQGCAIEY